MKHLDRADRQALVGVAVISLAVLWAAVVLGLAVLIVRLIGGL